jgi:hypothetical protein
MAIKRLFACASLFLLAFAAAPMAQAANDGDGTPAPGASSPAPSTSPPATTRPHHGPVDPAKRAAWRAARKQRREAHRQEHQRAHGTDPSATTGPAPN